MTVVAFAAPYLLDATTRFAESAAQLPGVELALITCEPAERVPEPLRGSLAAHWRIDDPLDTGQIARGVAAVSEHVGPVQRLIGVFEHLQVLEHPDEPLHRADVLAHRCDAAGDLPGIQRIVDPPVRRQRAAQRLGN